MCSGLETECLDSGYFVTNKKYWVFIPCLIVTCFFDFFQNLRQKACKKNNITNYHSHYQNKPPPLPTRKINLLSAYKIHKPLLYFCQVRLSNSQYRQSKLYIAFVAFPSPTVALLTWNKTSHSYHQ